MIVIYLVWRIDIKMKPLSIFFIVCLYLTNNCISWSQQTESNKNKDILSLVVSGLGRDAESALKNAFNTAVENTVNRVVDTKSIEKHSKSIEKNVYKDTSSFIQSFVKVEDNPDNNGLYSTKIKISLNLKSIYKRLDDNQIPYTEIEGEKIYRNLIQQEEEMIQDVELLDQTLTKLDMARNMFTMTLKNPKPKSIHKNGDQVNAVFEFVIRIKQEPFFSEYVSELEKVLQQVSHEKSQSTLLCNSNWNKSNDVFVQNISWIEEDILGKIGNGNSLVLLNTRRNYKGDSLDWKWYVVDASIKEVLMKHLSSPDTYLPYKSMKVRLDLLDENQQVIRSLLVSGDQLKPGQSSSNYFFPGVGFSTYRGRSFFLLSPFMFHKDLFMYNDVWASDIEIKMDMEELKRLVMIEGNLVD